jgi:hypothetical protein
MTGMTAAMASMPSLPGPGIQKENREKGEEKEGE